MMMRVVLGAGMACVMAAACSASTTSGGAAVDADDVTVASFAGAWTVSGHIVAPWFTGPGFEPEADQEILKGTLGLSETGATGPAALACGAATSAVEIVEANALFEGKVTDEGLAKSALGVNEDEVAVLRQTCAADGEAIRLYHLVLEDRLLLGLNDIVYQFDRKPAEPAQP